MRYAVKFDDSYWPDYYPYETWIRERLGPHNWSISSDWTSGWPTNSSRNYYIAVKDPSILTMMALALGEVDEN